MLPLPTKLHFVETIAANHRLLDTLGASILQYVSNHIANGKMNFHAANSGLVLIHCTALKGILASRNYNTVWCHVAFTTSLHRLHAINMPAAYAKLNPLHLTRSNQIKQITSQAGVVHRQPHGIQSVAAHAHMHRVVRLVSDPHILGYNLVGVAALVDCNFHVGKAAHKMMRPCSRPSADLLAVAGADIGYCRRTYPVVRRTLVEALG